MVSKKGAVKVTLGFSFSFWMHKNRTRKKKTTTERSRFVLKFFTTIIVRGSKLDKLQMWHLPNKPNKDSLSKKDKL